MQPFHLQSSIRGQEEGGSMPQNDQVMELRKSKAEGGRMGAPGATDRLRRFLCSLRPAGGAKLLEEDTERR